MMIDVAVDCVLCNISNDGNRRVNGRVVCFYSILIRRRILFLKRIYQEINNEKLFRSIGNRTVCDESFRKLVN